MLRVGPSSQRVATGGFQMNKCLRWVAAAGLLTGVSLTANATLIPFEDIDKRYVAEVPDTREKILVYCSSGERSRLACDFLGRAGYTNLYNVQDGLQGWRGPIEGEGEVTFIKLERRR